MVVHQLECASGMDEAIEVRVLAYCERTYGEFEIPEGKDFKRILLEALSDPETWAEDGDLPHLYVEVGEEADELERIIIEWSPVLIAEPDLSAIAASATEVLQLSRWILFALGGVNSGLLSAESSEDRKHGVWFGLMLEALLPKYRDARLQLKKRTVLYRTGQPLLPHRGPVQESSVPS